MTGCCGATINFEKYKFLTKFGEEEIKDIYILFNKYSKNKIHLNFQEFRNSLGVLGSKSSDWICRRMFDIIYKEGDNVNFILNVN